MNTVDVRRLEPPSDEFHQIQAEFALAYTHGEPLIALLERYPEHALALTDLAIALDLEAHASQEAQSDENLAAAAQALTRARNHVFGTPPTKGSPGLVARAKAMGYTVSQLAKELCLGGDVLVKLDRGLIQPETLPQRLLWQLADVLQWSVSCLPNDLTRPRGATALYSANTPPQPGSAQSFADALAASGVMSQADRRIWLEVLQDEGLLP